MTREVFHIDKRIGLGFDSHKDMEEWTDKEWDAFHKFTEDPEAGQILLLDDERLYLKVKKISPSINSNKMRIEFEIENKSDNDKLIIFKKWIINKDSIELFDTLPIQIKSKECKKDSIHWAKNVEIGKEFELIFEIRDLASSKLESELYFKIVW
ncbi:MULTISPECIES: hypothetical protein [Lysinibacillus]|uniref:hypothetical protein n=1 Tax=Lysinibacillus TaxID=400634 RepID=UPI00214B7076|nr:MULTISPECIES: hypothetical protein [Lysinibacillus]UUV24949.1 hypothetical protein NP781_25005 [Lysinibacillus sp. FN11]UYB47819.1 hypothetical protein OCI51_02360 [Lysinibacillus capsici]